MSSRRRAIARRASTDLEHYDPEIGLKLSQKFAVSQHVVYYWLQKGLVQARRIKPKNQMWIALTPQKEQELQTWVTNSKRIAKSKHWEVLNEPASCVV